MRKTLLLTLLALLPFLPLPDRDKSSILQEPTVARVVAIVKKGNGEKEEADLRGGVQVTRYVSLSDLMSKVQVRNRLFIGNKRCVH